MTSKQELFVSYYLGESAGNATKAAAMAGFKHPRSAGSRLLTFVDIARAIAEKLDIYAMPSKEVLSRLSELARSSADDFLSFKPDADPDYAAYLDLSKAKRRRKLGNIRKLKQTSRKVKDGDAWITEREIQVELADPVKPLAMLAKYHGLLTEKAEPDSTAEMLLEKHRDLLDKAYGATDRTDAGDGEGGGLPG
jgi:hypothetical protein